MTDPEIPDERDAPAHDPDVELAPASGSDLEPDVETSTADEGEPLAEPVGESADVHAAPGDDALTAAGARPRPESADTMDAGATDASATNGTHDGDDGADDGANASGASAADPMKTSAADGTDASPEGASAEAAPEAARFAIEEWVLSAIEALVLASSDPLYPSRARDIVAAEMADMDGMDGKPEPTTADMKQAFRLLQERWSDPLRPVAHGFRLVEIDGGLCVRTAAANARFIRRMQMGKPQKLSRASLETLSVVAYRQPVTKPQIEEIRGVDSSGALKALLDKKLVRILGKAEEVGRPLLYGTTKTFLEFFNLASLNELPTLKELHELEHGISPESAPTEAEEQRAVIMDLFNPEQVSAVSAETEQESTEALDALERALGEAKDVAKRASALVFGMQVDDEDAPAKPAVEAAPAEDVAPSEPEAKKEQQPAEVPPDEVKPPE